MGGLIKVVARLEDNSIISKTCIASTELNLRLTEDSFLEVIPSLIDNFNNDGECLRKVSDLSQKETISPTGYGIIFYDYKNKKAFSFHDYCGTLDLSILNMFNDLSFNDWVLGKKNQLNINLEKETVRNIKLFEELKEKDCLFKFRNNEKLDLKNMDNLSAFRHFLDEEEFMGKKILTLNSEFYRLKVKYPGWDFYSGSDDKQKMEILKEYLIKENLMDDKSLEEWNEYFN